MRIVGLSRETIDDRVVYMTRIIMKSFTTVMNTVADQFALDVIHAAGEEIAPTSEPVVITQPTTVSVDSLGQVYAEWSLQLTNTILPEIQEILTESIDATALEIETALEKPIPRVSSVYVEDWIDNASNRLKDVSTDVWETARNELSEGMKEGESIEQLQTRIRKVAPMSASRAERIARTEVISASNAGSYTQVKVSGLTGSKEWLATDDGRTRPSHKKAEGQKVAMNAPFDVGGHSLMFPGDPDGPASEVVNCRCTPVYDLDEEVPLSQSTVTAAGVADVNDISILGMIALIPTADDIARLVISNGEVADEIHSTLWFLGDITGYNEALKLSLIQRIQEIAMHQTAITANGFGAAMWNPASDAPCVIMNVGGECLEKIRHDIGEVLEEIWNLAIPQQHCPWVPHIALSYTNDVGTISDVIERLGPITFSHIRVAIGEDNFDIPLYDSTIVASVNGVTAMPYHVGTSAECGISEPYAVIKDDNGEVMGCHDTKDKAEAQIAAIHASEGSSANTQLNTASLSGGGTAWSGILVVEGVETGDGREFEPNSLGWGTPPYPLSWQRQSSDGHMGSVIVGRIDEIFRDPANSNIIRGSGVFDDNGVDGSEALRQVSEKFLKGISVDVDSIKDSDVEFVFTAGGPIDEDGEEMPDDLKSLFGIAPEKSIFHAGRIRGATLVALPAFVETQIQLVESEPTIAIPTESSDASGVSESEDKEDDSDEGLVASAMALSDIQSWMYDNPGLMAPTPLTITDDGRVFGHAALFGTCHIGVADRCVKPPYEVHHDFFALGEVLTASGVSIPVGGITLGTGHAASFFSAQEAIEHYDNTGTRVADISVGNDEFGIWVAGTLRPGLSDERIAELRASVLSGDWRRIGGQLRLVALLAVNVPGFPVPRLSTSIHSGKQMSLVASGIVTHETTTSNALSVVRRRIARQMRTNRAEAIRNRMKTE